LNTHQSRYNGEDKGEPIYLSVLGEVYDVTIGDEFYAVGNGYSFFAGMFKNVILKMKMEWIIA
jgi:predicted heme/steroid binding protein